MDDDLVLHILCLIIPSFEHISGINRNPPNLLVVIKVQSHGEHGLLVALGVVLGIHGNLLDLLGHIRVLGHGEHGLLVALVVPIILPLVQHLAW